MRPVHRGRAHEGARTVEEPQDLQYLQGSEREPTFNPKCNWCIAEEKRREQDRLLNQPRPCSSCGEAKPRDAYSDSRQWKSWDGYFRELLTAELLLERIHAREPGLSAEVPGPCFPVPEEEAALRARAEEAKEAERLEQIERTKTVQLYKFPRSMVAGCETFQPKTLVRIVRRSLPSRL